MINITMIITTNFIIIIIITTAMNMVGITYDKVLKISVRIIADTIGKLYQEKEQDVRKT